LNKSPGKNTLSCYWVQTQSQYLANCITEGVIYFIEGQSKS